MFGVNRCDGSKPAKRITLRRAIIACVLIGFAAGPGLLTFAVLQALYRELPAENIDTAVLASARTTSSSQHSSGNLLSPLTDRRVVVKAGSATRKVLPTAKRAADNPLKAYLDLRGAPDRLDLRLASIESDQGGENLAQTRPQRFRTVCVRLCDGYYFPVGYAATAEQFVSQEAQCQSQCGSPAKLYVYPTATGSPLQMRDLAGSPYLELATAFKFHTSVNASCTCRPQPWTEAASERHRSYAQMESAAKASQLIAAAATTKTAVRLTETAPLRRPLMEIQTARLDKPTLLQAVRTHKHAAVLVANDNFISVRDVTDQAEPKSDALERKIKRATILAALDLPPFVHRTQNNSTGPKKPRRETVVSTVSIKALLKPPFLLDEPEFGSNKSGLGMTYPSAKKKAGVTLVGFPGPSRQRAELTANEILQRNLNPLIR